MYFVLSILFLYTTKTTTYALLCYRCRSSDPSMNGVCNYTLQTPVPSTVTVSACVTNKTCVTFMNPYDNGAIWRDCSQNIWQPNAAYSSGNNNTCIQDPYSKTLFCNCINDFCNQNNTGNMTLFGK